MTVLILGRKPAFWRCLYNSGPQARRRPFGLEELNLVNDTSGHHGLGDAPTSHATDACAHGYQG